jgi:hypothetical protein
VKEPEKKKVLLRDPRIKKEEKVEEERAEEEKAEEEGRRF